MSVMRRVRACAADDAGMTIIEVMIAAVILFIVLTGVLGLIGVSTNMSMQAKQTAVLTNVVNSYVERVQAMDFNNVVVGADSTQLASSETTTVGSYSVTIQPTVTSGGNAGLKNLAVQATMTAPTGDTQSLHTTVVIRDRSAFMTDGLRNPETDPKVEWNTSVMPAEGEVVWADLKASGGTLRISADVEASEGRTIEYVVIQTDMGWTLQSPSGVAAEWTPGVQSWTTPSDFVWNTLQQEVVDIGPPEVLEAVIRDGMRTITIKAIDSTGAETSIIYELLVDNYRPAAPAPATASVTGLNTATFAWPIAYDGTTPAANYRVNLWERTMPGWITTGWISTSGAPSYSMTTTPFSRYWMQTCSVSPPPLNRASTVTGMANVWYSPPSLSGTSKVVAVQSLKYDIQVDLHCSLPQFPAYAVSYKWMEATSPSGPWTVLATTTDHDYQALIRGVKDDQVARYYRCYVTFTDGVSGNRVVDHRSTIVGPTSLTDGVLQEMWLP